MVRFRSDKCDGLDPKDVGIFRHIDGAVEARSSEGRVKLRSAGSKYDRVEHGQSLVCGDR